MKTRQIAIILFASATLLITSGCMSMMYNSFVDKEESADKMLSKLSPVSPDRSRVVFYMKRLSNLGIELEPGGSMGYADIEISIKSKQGHATISVCDRLAEVIDLPEDVYAFSFSSKHGLLGEKSFLSLDLKNGQTYFIETAKYEPAKLVPTEQAREDIRQADIRSGVRNESIGTLMPNVNVDYVPYSRKMSHKELTSLAKEFTPHPDRSRIYITKNTSNLVPLLIGLDCKADRKVKKNAFLCYDVVPGYHVVTLGSSLSKSVEKAHGINTVGGKCYFFNQGGTGDIRQRFISEEKGKKNLQKFKLQKNGFLKSIP